VSTSYYAHLNLRIVEMAGGQVNLVESTWVKSMLRASTQRQAPATVIPFAPYFEMRSAIKWAKNEIVMEFWCYWLHLFIRTNKYKYAILFLRFMHTMKALNPEITQLLAQNRVFSFSGAEGSRNADRCVQWIGMNLCFSVLSWLVYPILTFSQAQLVCQGNKWCFCVRVQAWLDNWVPQLHSTAPEIDWRLVNFTLYQDNHAC